MAAISRLITSGATRFLHRANVVDDLTSHIAASKHPQSCSTTAVTAEFQIQDRQYMCLYCEKQSLQQSFTPAPLLFTSIFLPKHSHFDAQHLLQILSAGIEHDDVYHRAFIEGIVIYTEASYDEKTIESWNTELCQYPGTLWSKILPVKSVQDIPTLGPSMLLHDGLFSVFRRYEDSHGALMTALLPKTTPYGFTPVGILSKNYQTLSVLTSSRLLSSGTIRRSLEGMRFVVKDCWRMKGLQNTMENRAYYQVNEKSLVTTKVVSKLIAEGASPVGMAKLSCFAGREEPVECGDYQLPFNPRGDGYQSPAGSSNGSAAAVASYDWLDFSIGTDTTGSGRRPAYVNGCFALRPSQQKVSVEGLIPTFREFDTIALFTRSLELLSKITTCVVDQPDQSLPEETKPWRLICPVDYFPVDVPAQMDKIESFLVDLETSLAISRERYSIRDAWKLSPPKEAGSMSLNDYLKDVATTTFLYAFYHSFDEFRIRYQQKYQRRPRVTAFTQWRWDIGQSINTAQHSDGLQRLDVYRRWFLATVMQHESFNTMIVLPVMAAVPHYRDDEIGPFLKQDAFDALFIAPILKAPELVVPIGQIPYHSRITDQTEHLPVAVSVLGLPGTDQQLIDTIHGCLKQAGRPDVVRAGSLMFHE